MASLCATKFPDLIQHLWLIDEYEAALRLIDAASQRVQPNHLLSYSRANALRYCGRIEEATAEFEKCIALAPNYPYAHWSLAYHAKANPLGSRVDRIRQALTTVSDDPIAQTHLRYALFKELDDLGNVDAAWPELQAGARIMRGLVSYDSEREEQALLTLRRLTDDSFVKDGAEQPAKVPIFIVGMPRTGTTVLERILGNHTLVASAGELNDFSRALSWESDHFYDVPATLRSLDRIKDVNFARVGEAYLRRTADRYGAGRYLIDKNPVNIFNAGFIAKALPQAKILCLLRNPMDTCFSNLKELFSGTAYGYSYDLLELGDHYTRFRQLAEHWQNVLPHQFHVVGYERLVADPLMASEEVMRFCGLPFEPICVDITRNTAPVSTASSSQVRQPINTRGVDAWRKYAKYLEPLEMRIRETFPSLR